MEQLRASEKGNRMKADRTFGFALYRSSSFLLSRMAFNASVPLWQSLLSQMMQTHFFTLSS
jgi:hypothetical protein